MCFGCVICVFGFDVGDKGSGFVLVFGLSCVGRACVFGIGSLAFGHR